MYLIFICACMSFMCTIYMPTPCEARRGCKVLWNWSCGQLWAPGTEPWFYTRAVSVLHWVISPVISPPYTNTVFKTTTEPLSQGFHRTWMEQDREEPSRIPFKCPPLFCFLLSWEGPVFNPTSCSMIYTLGKSGIMFAPLYHTRKTWT